MTEGLLDRRTSFGWARDRIRKVARSGIITTVAGGGTVGLGDGGSATSAEPYSPYGVAVDGAGNLFIASPYIVRKVSPGGIITTVRVMAPRVSPVMAGRPPARRSSRGAWRWTVPATCSSRST
jgi:hypothetical protein